MATTVYFGNKSIILPGTYSTVVSGIENTTSISSYGNVLIIDAGAGKGFNAAQGISGNGKETILALNYGEANTVIRGGSMKPFISALFNPTTSSTIAGIGTMYLVTAAAKEPADAMITEVDPETEEETTVKGFKLFGGSITATEFFTKDEGVSCNTVLDADKNLKQGYLLQSVYNTKELKGYIEVYLGTYAGVNLAGNEIDKTIEKSTPTLVFRSRRYSNPRDLVNYLNNSSDFKNMFGFVDLVANNDTFAETTGDKITFANGSENYLGNLTEVFPYIADIDFSYCMVLGPDGAQDLATDLYDYMKNEISDIKQMVTFNGGFEEAIATAQTYNDDAVVVCSGIVKKANTSADDGFITHDPMVTAGYILGRICGLSPEISVTLKSINIDGMDIEPSKSNLEDMLNGGVVSPYYDSDLGYYCVSQGVNSLQRNENFINDDATTYSIQAKRIIAQVMKNVQQRAKIEFFGTEKGVNRGTLSDAYLRAWTKGILQELTVSQDKTENNYITNSDVIRIETSEDNKFVYFEFTINGEITKVFFTGVVVG